VKGCNLHICVSQYIYYLNFTTSFDLLVRLQWHNLMPRDRQEFYTFDYNKRNKYKK